MMTSQLARERAEQLYPLVVAQFYLPESGLYQEFNPPRPESKPYSWLWPYSSLVSALNVLVRLPQGGHTYYDDLRKSLEVFEAYYDSHVPIPGYDDYPKRDGGGRKYYDDNEWLGLEFLNAYETLGDVLYLEKAKQAFEFAYSGWSDELGGGIYWRENDNESKNTCSNGPQAVLALRLYQTTHETRYKDIALAILKWLTPLRAPEGAYWDNIKVSDGTIDQRTYTYNTGTVLHSHALLYTITGETAHLHEAQALARGAHSHFAPIHPKADIHLYPKTPWFNTVLLRGYLALYAIDPNPIYVDSMRTNLDYAWEHARREDGLVGGDWSGETDDHLPHRYILDQGAMIELYALLGLE